LKNKIKQLQIGYYVLIHPNVQDVVMFDNCFINNDGRIVPVLVLSSSSSSVQVLSNFNPISSSVLPPTLCTLVSIPNNSSTNIHAVQAATTTTTTPPSLNDSKFLVLDPLGYRCIDDDTAQCTASVYSNSNNEDVNYDNYYGGDSSSSANRIDPLCYGTFDEIRIAEEEENMIAASGTNQPTTAVVRTYVLCPHRTYDGIIGGPRDVDHDEIGLVVKYPNVHIYCGSDGRSENQCRVTGGTIQIGIIPDDEDDEDKYNTNYNTSSSTAPGGVNKGVGVSNVTIRGLTFTEATTVNILVSRPGSQLTIMDCIFQVSSSTHTL
jgi:hypothetical protein